MINILYDDLLKKYCKDRLDYLWTLPEVEPGVDLYRSTNAFCFFLHGSKISHRLNGPAVIFKDEHHWYHYGRYICNYFDPDDTITNDYTLWLESNNIDFKNLSEDDKEHIKLIWS